MQAFSLKAQLETKHLCVIFFFLRWGIKWSKSFLRKVTALISILLLVFLLKNKFLYHFINLTSLHKHTYKLVKPCQAHNVGMFL